VVRNLADLEEVLVEHSIVAVVDLVVGCLDVLAEDLEEAPNLAVADLVRTAAGEGALEGGDHLAEGRKT
jgi:hypothetical protein